MIPTFIGAGVALIGLLLLFRGSLLAMFALLVACTLMPGSAALLLPALGGTSVPPVQFALPFMIARLFVGDTRFDLVWGAIGRNGPLLAYAFYGILIAMVGPHLFAGDMYVFPMHMAKSGEGSHMDPLTFTPQNVTSAVYLLGLLLISLSASVAMFYPGGARRLVKTAVVVVWVQAFLGVSGALGAHTAWNDVLDVFRNGSYAQLDQSYGSFARIRGIAPEPSSYAMSGFVWFVFMFECWIRGVLPRRTGPAAAAMGLVLLFSTSSTAYLGLAGYGVIFAARAAMVPGTAAASKILVLISAGLVGFIAIGCLIFAFPSFGGTFLEMLNTMTVGKSASGSAIERATFAHQGVAAFLLSHGMGIGPGSFRSSSLVTAVIGATGVVGTTALLIHLLRILKPMRPSTYLQLADESTSVGVAAAWAAFAIMIPASMVLPGVDPGPEFAVLGGAALALRWNPMVLFSRSAQVPLLTHGHEVIDADAAGVLPHGHEMAGLSAPSGYQSHGHEIRLLAR